MIETSEYMTSPVITSSTQASVYEIVELMNKHNIGSVVLVENDVLAGIVTERDILRKAITHETNLQDIKAEEIMTKDVRSVRAEASVMEISAQMKEHSMRRIVVVNENNQPIGIITSRDLIGLLV
ncbi:MAG: CBS domain-containing protein [Candidatus Woesearchaeota archaeon]